MRSTKSLERKTAPITDKIVCVADAMRDQSLAANIGRPEQYVTVYSGMETSGVSESARAARARYGDSSDLIATMSPSARSRGCFISRVTTICSISAPRAVLREFPNLKFLWVGDGLLRR